MKFNRRSQTVTMCPVDLAETFHKFREVYTQKVDRIGAFVNLMESTAICVSHDTKNNGPKLRLHK